MTTDKSPPGNDDGGAGDNNDLEMMHVTHLFLLGYQHYVILEISIKGCVNRWVTL